MTKLFIVRHGETIFNDQGKMQGRVNIPLSKRGKQQIQLLKNRLKQTTFDLIYCSPLQRAIETAHILKEKNDIIVSDNLTEFDFGDWDGKSMAEIKKTSPEDFQLFKSYPSQFVAHNNGEDYKNLFNRIKSFLAGIDYKKKTILIISHSFVIKTMLTLFHNRPIDKIWLPPMILPASLTIAGRDHNTWTIEIEGCCLHLQNMISHTLKFMENKVISQE